MDLSVAVLALITGYLIGAIPFSRLISLLVAKEDVIEDIEIPVPGTEETFRITATGASTASMRLGGPVGCLIGLLDILKVALPTLAFKLLFPGQPYFLMAAVAGMVGHNWPVFTRFKGGRGISAAYGGLLVVDWLGALICAFGGMFGGLLIFRDFLMAYISGLWLAIPWLWFTTYDPAYLLYAVAINILFILAMIPDLRQYLRLRKSGKIDMRDAMATSPLGRGMMKMMQKLRLMKE